ncbi:MAG TPA: hypothetical protein VNL15_07775 [Dehalococcoidia bacterium]|nr:hypothetical protein [Dehalococcoidia bacterium]
MELDSKQRYEAAYRGGFIEKANGGYRWFSTDSEFPISVWYPQCLAGPFYDYNRLSDLRLDFEDLILRKRNLTLARRVEYELGNRLAAGVITLEQFLNEELDRAKRYYPFTVLGYQVEVLKELPPSLKGETSIIRAFEYRWETSSKTQRQGVCFVRRRHELWQLHRDIKRVSVEDLNAVLASLVWLDDFFFKSLPVRFEWSDNRRV